MRIIKLISMNLSGNDMKFLRLAQIMVNLIPATTLFLSSHLLPSKGLVFKLNLKANQRLSFSKSTNQFLIDEN